MAYRRRWVEKQGAYYHLMSRTVNGEAWFGAREKEVLRKMIWQVAEFSGIRVITYAVMKNHFHLMVEVPSDEASVSDTELVRRYRILYPEPTPWQPMRAEVLERRLEEGSSDREELRRALLQRMHDVSWLMRTIKQRFSRWFNGSRGRFGPVWSERFKSVLIEGDRTALKVVAAYIDLNAVRAGLVTDPKDYRFCGYAEALGGSRLARAGLAVVDPDLAGYRQILYGVGSEEREGKRGLDRAESIWVLEKAKGRLPITDILRCRVRYLTDGKILGSQSFVEEKLNAEEERPARRSRKSHRMKGADWGGLRVATGLRKNLFR